MTPQELIQERGNDYDHPKNNFGLIAAYMTVYLREKLRDGCAFEDKDVGMFNIFQKISRQQFKYKKDNLDDIQGYAETLKELHEDN